MPMMKQRHRSRRPESCPSAPSYNRRANSKRKDIRMESNRRKNRCLPKLCLIAILVAGFLGGLIVLAISMGHKDAPLEGGASVPEKVVYEMLLPEKLPEEAENPLEEPLGIATEGLIYTDDRIPNYVASNPVWETICFAWESQDKCGVVQVNVSIDREMYRYYRGLGRYYGVDEYQNYINDANNKAIVAEIVKAIRNNVKNNAHSDAATAREIAKFVQDTIEYQYDLDTTGVEEYPRYPIETLYEQQGDCEDTSILMAALLKELGYEVGFLHLPGHLAVVLRTAGDYSGGDYYEIDGRRYLYIESTGSGWNIGDIPENVMGEEAIFYAIP